MKRLSFCLLVILAFNSAAIAQTALFSGATPPTARTQVDFSAAPYNASCNGGNDTTAFLAFRTAWQNSTPVTLNLPANGNCVFVSTSGNGLYPFKGIGNLIVDGQGATITNGAVAQPILFGGGGQFQDNAHSARVQTVSAGASCVTLITQTSTNISGAANGAGSAAFTGKIDNGAGGYGATLTVTAVSSGTLAVGQIVFGTGSTTGVDGTIGGTVIVSQDTGSAGGIGTYTVAASQILPSQSLTSNGAVRLTVGSAAGFTNGDVVMVRNVVGNTALQNATNGLRWSKKVDSTHIDLFQSSFAGTYTSGGTAGGDLTYLFPVGTKTIMTGFVLQAYWFKPYGFPSNQQFFEWKTVTSSDSGTQQVCFDTPLANSYKSTWPQYNTGSAFDIDPGGPATLYALDSTWETTQEYRNLTIDNTTGDHLNSGLTSNGRTIKYQNVTTSNIGCMIPSQNETYTVDGLTGTNCTIELDKLISTYNISNASIHKLFIQSSSTGVLNATNVTVDQSIAGTPRSFIGSGITLNGTGLGGNSSLQLGPNAYGAATGASSCTNCVIANDIGGATGSYLHPTVTPTACFTFGATGIITIPNWCSYGSVGGSMVDAEIQTRWAVPGANFYLNASIGPYALGQVTDVTQDLTNIYIQTNFTSGFPAAPSGGVTSLAPHAAPSWTRANLSGNFYALGITNCPAATPIFSCFITTYTDSSTGTTDATKPRVVGSLSSISMTPHPLYSGVGALTWRLSDFYNWTFVKSSDGSTISYDTSGLGPVINAKVGDSVTRTITATTTANGQSGDSIHAPGFTVWIPGPSNSGPVWSANTPSDSPVISLDMRTNQGVVYPFLLKRDVLPDAGNDNTPMWLDQAA